MAFSSLRAFVFIVAACVFVFWGRSVYSSDDFIYLKDVDRAVEEMSLKDKIGQVFFSIIYGEELNDRSKAFVEKTHVGNFILFPWANKLSSFEQIRNLTCALKSFVEDTTKVVPLIATDQEGGKVSRLTQGFTSFPCNRDVAGKLSYSYSFNMGRKMAEEMKNAGVNLNFAPVVDVCIDSTSWIAPRCYGDNADIVISYAAELIRGMHSSGMLITLKHFPGHGDTKVNSHTGLPTVNKYLENLLEVELKPFLSLKDQADFIMTAHILFPYLDKDNPATFSKSILTDLLINKFNYKGVIICDSLAMRAAVPNQANLLQAIEGMSSAAIKSFNAGCDMLILSKLEWADFVTSEGEDFYVIEQVIEKFTAAVKDGTIPMKKLDDSVKKILSKKIAIQN